MKREFCDIRIGAYFIDNCTGEEFIKIDNNYGKCLTREYYENNIEWFDDDSVVILIGE